MSHAGAIVAGGLKVVLERAAGQLRRTTDRAAWLNLGWRWLALLGALFTLDLLFALPVALRWVGLLGQAGFIGWGVKGHIALRARWKGEEQHTARMLEERHPELDSALINAVQFDKALPEAHGTQASLMRREIERAESVASQTQEEDAVDRSSERHALKLLAGFAGAWALVAVLFGGAFTTIIPRLFAPWMDDLTPPFSLTKIQISPAGAQVRFGGSLRIDVAVSGPTPEMLVLETRSGDGAQQRVELEGTEPGKYAAVLDGLKEDTWYCAIGGGTRSARYLAKVVLPPAVGELKARYTYPKYSGREVRTDVVDSQGIHALRGSKALIQVQANRALQGGELVLEYGARQERLPLSLDPKDPAKAFAEMRITENGTFRLSLTSDDSQQNPAAAKGKIVAERDEHPAIWIAEPASELVVTPNMKVRIQVVAEDDIGVRQVNLHRVINDISDVPVGLYNAAPVKHTEGEFVVDLGDLGVRPGDEITYYADAYDNDPGRPNYAETEPYKMRVVDEAEFKKMLEEQRTAEQLQKEIQDIKDAVSSLAAKQQELAERMDKLQKLLAKNPGDPSLQKQMKAAQAEQKALAEEAARMAEQLKEYANSPSASEIEAAIKKQVGQVAEQIAQAAQGPMKRAQGSNPGQAAQAAKQAANALQKAADQTQQKVAKPIEHVEKVAPLFMDVERFKALLDLQGQLVRQARQFQDKAASSPQERSKLEHIAAQQERIKDELKQLQQDFRSHAADAQKDFPKAAASAMKIADEIGRRQIADHMQRGQDEFSKANGQRGFESAQLALKEMQAMMSQCKAGQGQCEGELDIKLSQSLGQSGLGQSLSDCLNPGMGQGMGTGQGRGMSGSRKGSTPNGAGGQMGGYTMRGPSAYVMTTRQLRSGGGLKRMTNKSRAPGQPADLAPESVEYMKNPNSKPPQAADSAAGGYPAEYRKLIKDYFKSVTKEKR